jgi:prophage regulatory protein
LFIKEHGAFLNFIIFFKRSIMQEKNIVVGGLIRFPELKKLCGLSRSTVWRLEKAGEFPKKIQIGARAIAWLFDEIQLWIETKKENRKSFEKDEVITIAG